MKSRDLRAIISQWLTDDTGGEPLRSLALIHLSPSGKQREVHAWRPTSPGRVDAQTIAKTFDAVATRHAARLLGVQQYQLEAAYGDSTDPTRTLPFLRMGKAPAGAPQFMYLPVPVQQHDASQGTRLLNLLGHWGLSRLSVVLDAVTFPVSDEDAAMLRTLVTYGEPEVMDDSLRKLSVTDPEGAEALTARVREIRQAVADERAAFERLRREPGDPPAQSRPILTSEPLEAAMREDYRRAKTAGLEMLAMHMSDVDYLLAVLDMARAGGIVSDAGGSSPWVTARPRAVLTPGDAVRATREAQGLSLAELANRLDTNTYVVEKLESGQRPLCIDEAERLARALKVHPAVLMWPNWEAK